MAPAFRMNAERNSTCEMHTRRVRSSMAARSCSSSTHTPSSLGTTTTRAPIRRASPSTMYRTDGKSIAVITMVSRGGA